jgi:hypothetical protein
VTPVATGFALPQASSSPARPTRRRLLLGAGLVTALALAIRLVTLDEQSFWLDEAYTVHLVGLDLGAMLRQIPRSESTPPLYYVLAWVWSRVFGTSEFGLRSLSALAGTATVTLSYLLTARLAGLRAAVITSLLLAVSPLMVWYSQEARAYALAALLACASVLCVIRYAEDADRRWLSAWALCSALGLCTHYFVGFVVVAELGWLLRYQRRTEVRLAAALVVLVAAALVPLAVAQRGTGHADYIAQGSLGARLLQVPKQFLVGYASPGQRVTAVVVALVLLAGSLWPLIRYRSRLNPLLLLPLAAGLFAVVVPALLALVGIDFLDTRNVLVALPLLLVVAGAGFAASPGRSPALAAGLVFVLLSATIVVLVDTHVQYQRTDWRGAAAALGQPETTRALVIPGEGQLPVSLYLPRTSVLPGPVPVREIDIVALPSNSNSGGQGTPPRPSSPQHLPPGFTLTSANYNRVYTVLRYRSARAAIVTPTQMASLSLGPGGAAVLLQRP